MARAPWYQDRARLAAAVAEHGSVKRAAEQFGTPVATVTTWARRLNVRSGHPKTPLAHQVAEARAAAGVTYLVGAVGTGRVKIGRTSGSARVRMATMQTGSPVPLLLLCTLPHTRWEDVLHAQYDALREQGEWFTLTLEDVRDVMRFAARGLPLTRDGWPTDEAARDREWTAPSEWLDTVFSGARIAS